MSDTITLTGVVATPPRTIRTGNGLAITSFRLASSQRWFDRKEEKWIEGETNWYTVTTFRQLAANSAISIGKGERIIVTGKVRIREWKSGERTGTNIDVEADALGHDLTWGTAAFSRNAPVAPAVPTASEYPVDAPETDFSGSAYSYDALLTSGEPPEGDADDAALDELAKAAAPLSPITPF